MIFAVFCVVTLGLAFGGQCFWGGRWGCDIGIAPKLCFRDKFQLKWRFWWMGVCLGRIEIIPNVWCGADFVEAYMI